jgi:hypothetical protein
MEEMDEEKKKKLTEKLKEVGLDEKIVDEHMLHLFKKVYFKLMKLRFHLDKEGVSDEKVKEIFEKMIEMVMAKDLEKMKEWYEEHKDEHGPGHEHHHHHDHDEKDEEDEKEEEDL